MARAADFDALFAELEEEESTPDLAALFQQLEQEVSDASVVADGKRALAEHRLQFARQRTGAGPDPPAAKRAAVGEGAKPGLAQHGHRSTALMERAAPTLYRKPPGAKPTAPEDIEARAAALLRPAGSAADPELQALAQQLAVTGEGTRKPKTISDHQAQWALFSAWWGRRGLPGTPYDAPGEVVALYLLSVLNAAKADGVGPARVDKASAAIACYHELAGLSSPTSHPACGIVRELAARTLRARRLVRDAMTPADLLQLATAHAGPQSPLPDLMMVAVVAVMFAGFLRFDDVANVSADAELLRIDESHMEVFIPASKTDQRMTGHWVVISRVGGPACPVALVELLLERGGYVRSPQQPGVDAGPLLRACQRVGGASGALGLRQLVGTASRPVRSLSRTAFAERLADLLRRAGLSDRILPHSMRIGGNSAAAANGVPAELRKSHGRWRCDSMVEHYTRRGLEAALGVTRNLGLA